MYTCQGINWDPNTPRASPKVAFLRYSLYISSWLPSTFLSTNSLMIGPIVTIWAISSERAALPPILKTPFQNINCLTFPDIFRTRADIGAKASILAITPPKAPTHIIITITQEPASPNPLSTKPKKEGKLSTVPANVPKINEEAIPKNKQSKVGTPITATIITSIRGITI